MYWIIAIVLVVAFFAVIINSSKKTAESNAEYKKSNALNNYDVYETDFKYISGHPSVNKNIEYPLTFFRTNKKIRVTSKLKYAALVNSVFLFELNNDSITNIVIEDSTTIEKRVTFTRLLAVGIFAFAWKKKKVNELAYIVITYNDGRFSNDIVLQIEGSNAMLNANQLRNRLIEWVK